MQSTFGDLKVCGKEMDSTFDGSLRVDPELKLCKADQVKCSDVTDPENTVCLPLGSDLTKECPITELRLFSMQEVDDLAWQDSYTLVTESLGEFSLGYSKFAMNNAPLGKIRAELNPCIKPDEISSALPSNSYTE
jgi:hypothetical protein